MSFDNYYGKIRLEGIQWDKKNIEGLSVIELTAALEKEKKIA